MHVYLWYLILGVFAGDSFVRGAKLILLNHEFQFVVNFSLIGVLGDPIKNDMFVCIEGNCEVCEK